MGIGLYKKKLEREKECHLWMTTSRNPFNRVGVTFLFDFTVDVDSDPSWLTPAHSLLYRVSLTLTSWTLFLEFSLNCICHRQ